MTNRLRGVLYIGITSDLSRRIWQHREGLVEGFTSRYGLTHLVYYETFPLIADAIRREKNLKGWHRQWKIELIESTNPQWRDLYEELNA